jgi:predicted nucleotide-binding protein
VFVVHGHDGEARESVARLIEKQGLNAVVLHEQPNEGRTVIEKFERYAAQVE